MYQCIDNSKNDTLLCKCELMKMMFNLKYVAQHETSLINGIFNLI